MYSAHTQPGRQVRFQAVRRRGRLQIQDLAGHSAQGMPHGQATGVRLLPADGAVDAGECSAAVEGSAEVESAMRG